MGGWRRGYKFWTAKDLRPSGPDPIVWKPKRQRPATVQQTLQQSHGGQWKYDRKMQWWECNDGRIARRCCTCFMNAPSDDCNCTGRIMVYEKGHFSA